LRVLDEGYSNLSTLRILDEGYSNLSTLRVLDEGYSNLSTLRVLDEGYSNLSTLRVLDEGYSRNAKCALNLISTFLLKLCLFNISTRNEDMLKKLNEAEYYIYGSIYL
jgi:hypothetical protein